MAFDPVSYIVQTLREYDSSIDVGPGSVVRDFLINPLSSLLESYYKTHRIFEKRLSLLDINALSESAMDDIASNFLVSRAEGSHATGYVRIYFKDAQNILIPKYTVFKTSTGKEYYSQQEHSITRSQMLSNLERYPLYSTGDILVIAAKPGKTYELGPQEIVSATNIGSTYELVTNTSAFSGASERDTNLELYNKILDSAYNLSVASVKGISKRLIETFGTITDVYVAGAGHALMSRDLIVDTARPDVASYTEIDFNGKILGQNITPYNPSRAYYALIVDQNLGNSGLLPSEIGAPNTFTREFSQAEYSKLFKADAAITAITPSRVLVYETFEASGYDSNWIASDERMGVGVLLYSGEVALVNTAIYLGNDSNRAGNFLAFETMVQISGYLDEMTKHL